MIRVTSLALAAALASTSASALTLDFSNGSFDGVTDTFTFLDVATIGMQDVNMIVTSSPSIDSFNEANNGNFSTDSFSVNLLAQAGTESRLTFSFVDDLDNPVVINDLEVGVFDLDFFMGEVIAVQNSVSYTVTDSTGLDITGGFDLTIAGVNESDVPNPGNLSSLTPEQQDASVLLEYGSVSSFVIDLLVDRDGTGGRNFFFGNFSFTEPTTTVDFQPIPVPPAMMLMIPALGLLALRRRRSA